MATIKELKELALHAAKGTAPSNFTNENVSDAFLGEMQKLACDFNTFQRNKYDIFEIIMAAADEIVPNKVIAGMSAFADVQVVPFKQKVIFRKRVGKSRAKLFLTRAAAAGVYETFRLDNETFELGAYAIGGAARIDFERFLDGTDNMADLMEIVTEGLTDAVFGEVQKALIAAKDAVGRPDANKVISSKFESDKMFKLVSVVKAYGGAAVIFAPPEFVGEMGPDAIVPVSVAGQQAVYHPNDIDAIYRTGYVNVFRGTPIVQIPQSFIDQKNDKTWINPQFAYVLPAGKEKIVKIVFEGATQMWDFVNRDQSIEIHTYKKMGAAIMTHHNWGIYQNTSIPDTSDFPYGI